MGWRSVQGGQRQQRVFSCCAVVLKCCPRAHLSATWCRPSRYIQMSSWRCCRRPSWWVLPPQPTGLRVERCHAAGVTLPPGCAAPSWADPKP